MSRKETFSVQRFTGERLTHDLLKPNPSVFIDIRKRLGSSPFGIVEIAQSHLQRYYFANNFIGANSNGASQSVLDIACGVGYGSRILSNGNRIVTAADIDEASVKEALKCYPSINGGVVADGLHLPFGNASFDYVVSFETFEHVPYPQIFLEELSRVIKPSGYIILSTPNRDVTKPGAQVTDKPDNAFHAFEMNPREFSDSLRAVFPDVRLFGQNQIQAEDSIQRLRALRMGVPGRIGVRMVDLANIRHRSGVSPIRDGCIPTYMVAVCSNGKKNDIF